MDDVWREDDTTPGAIEAALRKMFAQRHKEERAYVPARVMNMVVIVDKDFRGEVENRLQRVGRYHPSRLIVAAVEPGRRRLSAVARIGTDDAPQVRRDHRRARADRAADRRAPSAQARHDRRPAGGLRPRHDGLVAARQRRRRSTRCGGWRRSS